MNLYKKFIPKKARFEEVPEYGVETASEDVSDTAANRINPSLTWGRMTQQEQKSSRRFFTLIELLVVIAIIGLLAGMLVPALIKAKAASQTPACLNQLKNIGVASMQYSGDYNDGIVLGKRPGSGLWRNIWRAMLCGVTPEGEYSQRGPYGISYSDQYFTCPSQVQPVGSYGHYLANENFMTTANFSGESKQRAYHANKIKGPSIVKMFFDSGVQNSYAVKDGKFAAFRHGPNGDARDKNFPGGKDTPKPEGLFNVVFLDGHAESMTVDEFAVDGNWIGKPPLQKSGGTYSEIPYSLF